MLILAFEVNSTAVLNCTISLILARCGMYITMVFEVPIGLNTYFQKPICYFDDMIMMVFLFSITWVYVLTASCVHKCNNWQLTLHCAVNKHAVTTSSRYRTV